MDLNASSKILGEGIAYGFILAIGSGLLSFIVGYSVKSVLALLNKIVK